MSAASSTKRPTREGVMSKLGGVRKNWKKRFFALKHGHLAYFDPDAKAFDAPLGIVNVTVHRAELHLEKVNQDNLFVNLHLLCDRLKKTIFFFFFFFFFFF
jgi:hypothetical protein